VNRRGFLKATSAVPAVALLPSIAVAKADEKKTEVKCDQGWPKLMVGDVVARTTDPDPSHNGFILVNDEQTIHGMVVAADDYTYRVALIESPETKRLFRHRLQNAFRSK